MGVTSQPSSNHVVQSCCRPPLRSKLPRRTPRCRHWRGKLRCGAFQGSGREVAPGMPCFGPLLLRIRVLPTRGELARRSFRDCNGVSNGRPLAPEAIAAENEAIAHGDASAANLLVVPAGGSVAGAAPVAVAPAPAPVAVAPAAPVAPAAVAAGKVYAAAAPVATYAPGVTYNTPYAGYAGAVYPGYAANGAYAAAPAAAYAAAPAAYATHAVPAATYAAHY